MKRRLFFICFILCLSIYHLKAQLTFPHLTVLYDSAWSYKNLHLIPIRFTDSVCNDKSFPASFITLANAIQNKKVVIKENSYDNNANVNIINIKNISKDFVYVKTGDLLKGGKQDRMIAETKMLAPGNEVEYLNVYCIEKGRWSKKAKPFTYAGYGNLNLRKAADSNGVQQHVWKEIEKQFNEENMQVENFPFLQIKNKKPALKDYEDFFINKFKQSDSLYAGFIVMSDSVIIGCDVFINEKLLAAAYNDILYSYISGVKNPETKTDVDKIRIRDFAFKLFATEALQKKFLEHNGKAFQYHNKTLHITAYDN